MNHLNMITNKNEAKATTKHISCDCNCKFDSTTCNSKQKWNNEICQFECKNYCKCKNDYSWNPSTYICENSKYLTSNCMWWNMDIVPTKMTNTIATNVTKNYYTKNLRDCYILHIVLLSIILLMIITIICYYYVKHRSEEKLIDILPI